jgi:hypothetical protein
MAIQPNEANAMIVQSFTENEKDLLQYTNRFLWHLMKNVKDGSGLFLQIPMKLLANTTQGVIPLRGATVDLSLAQQYQYGVLNWKANYFATNLDLKDFALNKGKTAIHNLIESKIEGAESDYTTMVSQHLVLGTSVDALAPDGLLDVIAPSGTPYAGLVDTDYTDQAPAGLDPYLPFVSEKADINYGTFNEMSTKVKARMQQNSVRGKLIGFWPSSIAIPFQNSEQGKQRFTDAKELESGFEGTRINGVNMFLDENLEYVVDDEQVYTTIIFPEDIFRIYAIYGFGKEKSPFDGSARVPNAPLSSAQKYCVFNLACVARRLVAYNSSMNPNPPEPPTQS